MKHTRKNGRRMPARIALFAALLALVMMIAGCVEHAVIDLGEEPILLDEPTAEPIVSATQDAGPADLPAEPVQATAGQPVTEEPAAAPTAAPGAKPTAAPTAKPTIAPTAKPTAAPTAKPTAAPTAKPTAAPTAKPTAAPTAKPTAAPTAKPTAAPTAKPTAAPTAKPTAAPTAKPTAAPTAKPTASPTAKATKPLFGNFSAKDVNGNTVTNSVFAGHEVTMVNIWASYCSPCAKELPDLAALHEEYRAQGFQVVGIILDAADSKGNTSAGALADAKDIIGKTGAGYTHIIPTSSMFSAYLSRVSSVPTTVFVNSDGEIIGSAYAGAKSKSQWASIIEEKLG